LTEVRAELFGDVYLKGVTQEERKGIGVQFTKLPPFSLFSGSSEKQ